MIHISPKVDINYVKQILKSKPPWRIGKSSLIEYFVAFDLVIVLVFPFEFHTLQSIQNFVFRTIICNER